MTGFAGSIGATSRGCYAVPRMDVSVRELRNHTAKVVAAIESGERVVLTVHGRPVADIVPRVVRSERRSTEAVLAGLGGIAELADELNVTSDPADFESGMTTDESFA